MSKLYEGILIAVLLALLSVGVAFLGSIIRSHILLPISTLIITLLLAFLFYKTPDFFDDGSHSTALKYNFYISVAVSFTCFVFANKGEAYIEKYLIGGHVKSYEVEVEGENGEQGSDTDYYLEGIDPTTDRIIRYAYWIVVLGTPFLVWKMWRKVA